MTYWLSRAGSTQVDGPLTKRQIQSMWSQGQITAADQLCLTDVPEGWLPAGMVADQLDGESVSESSAAAMDYAKKKRKAFGAGGCSVLFFGLLTLPFFWPAGLLLIAAALVIDQMGVKLICTRCGNVTVQTANQCACCRALFVRDSLGKRLLVGLAQVALCLVLVWGVVWIASLRHSLPVRVPTAMSRPAPAHEPLEDESRLRAVRDEVMQYYQAKGLELVPTIKPRTLTMRMRTEDADAMTDAQLESLASAGLGVWRSQETGFFVLMIVDSEDKYLVSADPIAIKVLRR